MISKQQDPHASKPPATAAGWLWKHMVGRSPKLEFQHTWIPRGCSACHLNSFSEFNIFTSKLRARQTWKGCLRKWGGLTLLSANLFLSLRHLAIFSVASFSFRGFKIALSVLVWPFSTVWPIVGCYCCWIKYVQFSTNYGNLLSHFGKCQQGYSLT